MNLAPVIRGMTCPPSPSAAHGNGPASLAGCIVLSLDASSGPHYSGASSGPTVSRIIRPALIYDKSLLQSLRRLDVARLLCQHHALRKAAAPIPAKPHHAIR